MISPTTRRGFLARLLAAPLVGTALIHALKASPPLPFAAKECGWTIRGNDSITSNSLRTDAAAGRAAHERFRYLSLKSPRGESVRVPMSQ